MEQDNKYKEYSAEKVNIYKKSWDKDFFDSIRIEDSLEVVFIIAGLFTFLYLSWGLKVIFIVALLAEKYKSLFLFVKSIRCFFHNVNFWSTASLQRFSSAESTDPTF